MMILIDHVIHHTLLALSFSLDLSLIFLGLTDKAIQLQLGHTTTPIHIEDRYQLDRVMGGKSHYFTSEVSQHA